MKTRQADMQTGWHVAYRKIDKMSNRLAVRQLGRQAGKKHAFKPADKLTYRQARFSPASHTIANN